MTLSHTLDWSIALVQLRFVWEEIRHIGSNNFNYVDCKYNEVLVFPF